MKVKIHRLKESLLIRGEGDNRFDPMYTPSSKTLSHMNFTSRLIIKSIYFYYMIKKMSAPSNRTHTIPSTCRSNRQLFCFVVIILSEFTS